MFAEFQCQVEAVCLDAGGPRGRDIPPGWDLDCDKLLNGRVQLVVAKAKGNDGGEFNKVKDLLPIRRPQFVVASSAPQPVTLAPAASNGSPDAWDTLIDANGPEDEIPY